MKSINLEAKTVTKKVTHTVVTKETKPEQYLRIVKEFGKFIDGFDTTLSCCPRKNGSIVPCDKCKFKQSKTDGCLQIKLSDTLNQMQFIEE